MRPPLLLILLVAGLILATALWFYKTPVQPPGQAFFGGVSLNVDYATTSAAREQGLSGRADIPEDYGMLFVFPRDDRHGFWMKDTLAPLDIFWLDAQGQVVWVEASVATSTYPYVFYPPAPARYVLETAAGFSDAHEVGIGAKLVLPNWPEVSE